MSAGREPSGGPAACAGVRAELPLFVGDDLRRDEAAAVGAHLRECPACRAEASAFLQSRRALQRSSAAARSAARGVDEDFFADLHGRILAGVEVAMREESFGGAAAGRQRGGPSRWAAVAAAVLLFTCGVAVSRLFDAPGGDDGPGLVDRPAIRAAAHGDAARHVNGFGRLMRPLGHDAVGEDVFGMGLRGRLELRTLEETLLRPAALAPAAADPAGSEARAATPGDGTPGDGTPGDGTTGNQGRRR